MRLVKFSLVKAHLYHFSSGLALTAVFLKHFISVFFFFKYCQFTVHFVFESSGFAYLSQCLLKKIFLRFIEIAGKVPNCLLCGKCSSRVFFPPIFWGRQSFVLFLMQFVLASRQLSVTIGVSLGVSRAVLLLFWFLVFLNSFQRLVFFTVWIMIFGVFSFCYRNAS